MCFIAPCWCGGTHLVEFAGSTEAQRLVLEQQEEQQQEGQQEEEQQEEENLCRLGCCCRWLLWIPEVM